MQDTKDYLVIFDYANGNIQYYSIDDLFEIDEILKEFNEDEITYFGSTGVDIDESLFLDSGKNYASLALGDLNTGKVILIPITKTEYEKISENDVEELVKLNYEFLNEEYCWMIVKGEIEYYVY